MTDYTDDQLIERYSRLVDKKYETGLSDIEAAELESLNDEIDKRDAPMYEEAKALLERARLRILAERLAVKVCGWHLVVFKSNSSFNTYYDDSYKEIMLVSDWRPWERLEQAWMIVNGMKRKLQECGDRSSDIWCFLTRVDSGEITNNWLFDLDSSEYARAIFDAACQAMGWEAE